jgi:predicted helicase
MHITATHKRAIDHYYQELAAYHTLKVTHETGVRSAFQNLLATFAQSANWTLIPEQAIANGKRPDGTLRDTFNLPRGYWEAKDTRDDLNSEIRKKINAGYPVTNTIFEDTRRAILYQSNKPVLEVDLTQPKDLTNVLDQFFHYAAPDIATFEQAVQDFKESIPDLAQGLLKNIKEEHARNKTFVSAFATFLDLCRTSLDPNMSSDTVNEMLVQHLLTERLFRTIFHNPDFTRRNVIAAEIEKVIQTLTSRAFNRSDFEKSTNRFYVAIENAARGLDDWTEKQHFLNTVYERFFQGFSIKQADTHGIVYTPQEIVDFMCASVEEVLQREFHTSLSQPGVQILDPATGTGNFIVNLIQHINGSTLAHKYENDFFCNEILLLPYYIASINVEHAYFERTGEYKPFEGICFTDTLELAEGRQMPLFVEENTERVEREKAAQIMVVICNPPYNAGQRNENDNNKNRRYPVIDERIRKTYVKNSHATLNNMVYDAYVRFFRWATDRLQERDGIVCFISNNSFLEGFAFDGFRKQLIEEFTDIYHIDLSGNARRSGGGNVFGIKVGVGITVAVRNSKKPTRNLYYYRMPEYWHKTSKLTFLAEKISIANIEWQELYPDQRYTWLTEGLHSEFDTFISIGTKEAKASQNLNLPAIFRMYSGGVKTNRDNWNYDFNHEVLATKIHRFIETYNSEVDRWRRRGSNTSNIDDFVIYDVKRIKWSGDLKDHLIRGRYTSFTDQTIRQSLYRPFVKKYLYFDPLLNNRRYLQHLFFSTPSTEAENMMILAGGYGRKHFAVLLSNKIPDLNFYADPAQCFPYYTYMEDGSNRRENITNWALIQFQAKYGTNVTKHDIFSYVYAILHHPQYRERYAENLKRDLPHIPLLHSKEAFLTCVRIGRQLMDIHLHYEQAQEYPLKWIENREVPFSWRVEKMRLTPDKTAVVVNESLTLTGIPQENVDAIPFVV